jgi:gas vesicle protein
MIKIISWILGLSAGAALGALIIALFVPETSRQIRQRFVDGYQGALAAAKEAQDTRRQELEAELAQMQGQDQTTKA